MPERGSGAATRYGVGVQLRLDTAPGPTLRVSELVGRARRSLAEEPGEVWVEGELGSLHRSRLGHVYFDLRDEWASLRCALFRRAAEELDFPLEDGLAVRARGRLDVYPERGALQLVVEQVEPAGEGALRVAFERLQQRLRDEGLFDPGHKRPLPFLPRRIGLVTSVGGAALHDVVRGLHGRRGRLDVLVCDARVQGDGAWRQVVRGLHLLDAVPEVDVIVLARGGGSLEDLWTFNREEVVRAIFEVDTPVVSAIGHEVDVVLADLVADARAATPTAAAELVAPDAAELERRVGGLERRLEARQRARVEQLRARVDSLRRGLVHPAHRLAEVGRRLEGLKSRLRRSARLEVSRRGDRVAALGGRLDALSPLAVLGRGYSIARRESDGAILRASGQVDVGDGVRIRLAEGGVRARVTSTSGPEENA